MIYQGLDLSERLVNSDFTPTAYFEAWLNGVVDIYTGLTIDDDYNVNSDYFVIRLDATSNDVAATLPSAADYKNKGFRYIRLDGSGFVAKLTSGDNINGSNDLLLSQYDAGLVISDGFTWNKF